jgi:hypothetical protein
MYFTHTHTQSESKNGNILLYVSVCKKKYKNNNKSERALLSLKQVRILLHLFQFRSFVCRAIRMLKEFALLKDSFQESERASDERQIVVVMTYFERCLVSPVE